MNYEELILFLQNNHIYPIKAKKDLATGKLLSVQVTCSPILKDSKIEYLKKLLGDEEWKYIWFGNDNDYIEIKKVTNENNKRNQRRVD